MSLEDGIEDVISKAIGGLGLELQMLADRCGFLPGDLSAELDHTVLRKIAAELRLDPDALVGLATYLPELRNVQGLTRIELPFRDWTVNAWLIEKNGIKVLFDTGWGSSDILQRLNSDDLACVLITHGHVDHVGGIQALENTGVRVVREDEAMISGKLDFGDFSIEVFDLSGHCDPAVGYLVSGFEKDMVVVGDAIFAGSAGRCKSPSDYKKAFQTMRAGFTKLSDDVLILPGHGPMTSMGEERRSNPFRTQLS